MRLGRRTAAMLCCVLGSLAVQPAPAFGPAGHRIAGRLAEPLLCESAAARVAELGRGEDLGALGLWADRIRNDAAWGHTAPWHYVNIEDGARLEAFEHPPEGDVLWAIEHHAARLGGSADPDERAEALRFLVHFIVDIHQPLHVGRESDRGGNRIDVRFNGATMSLHRFWDTEAVARGRTEEGRYIELLEPVVAMLATGGLAEEPIAWAAESLALRPAVYAFRSGPLGIGELDDRYLERADIVARLRLAQAAVRLAAVLNRVLAHGERC